MDEKRRALWTKQTDDLYRAIGRFVVSFEHVCHAMSMSVSLVLQHAGLRNQQLGLAVLADLTADPLRKIFLSAFAEIYEADPQSLNIVRDLSSRVQNLIQVRNANLHSTWFVGWASEQDEDFSRTHGVRIRNTKMGPRPEGATRPRQTRRRHGDC